jgi:hypothetical protein
MTGIGRQLLGINYYSGHWVRFLWCLSIDQIIIDKINYIIYLHPNNFYKFCFIGGVNQQSINAAIEHATNKVNNFIDNYKY